MHRYFLFLLLVCGLAAQPVQNVTVQPDCVINLSFTTNGQTSPTAPNLGYNNKTGGCTTWTMQVAVTGFTGTPTVTLQSAPDSAGVAGTWVTFAGGTIISPTPNNVNPVVTTTTGFVWEVGAAAWVRALFSAATGSGQVTGTLLGYRSPANSSNGTGGAASNVTIVGPLGQALMAASVPVAIASDQSAIPVTTSPFCTKTANVALSGTGYTQLIAASGATVIYICNVAVTSAATGSPVVNTFTFAFGACGGSPTQAVGPLVGVTGYTDQFSGALQSASGAAFCGEEATANSDVVTVTYAQK